MFVENIRCPLRSLDAEGVQNSRGGFAWRLSAWLRVSGDTRKAGPPIITGGRWVDDRRIRVEGTEELQQRYRSATLPAAKMRVHAFLRRRLRRPVDGRGSGVHRSLGGTLMPADGGTHLLVGRAVDPPEWCPHHEGGAAAAEVGSGSSALLFAAVDRGGNAAGLRCAPRFPNGRRRSGRAAISASGPEGSRNVRRADRAVRSSGSYVRLPHSTGSRVVALSTYQGSSRTCLCYGT